jgi:hypothetical protein
MPRNLEFFVLWMLKSFVIYNEKNALLQQGRPVAQVTFDKRGEGSRHGN